MKVPSAMNPAEVQLKPPKADNIATAGVQMLRAKLQMGISVLTL